MNVSLIFMDSLVKYFPGIHIATCKPIPRQRLGKHIPATNAHAKIERYSLLDNGAVCTMFPTVSDPRLYNESLFVARERKTLCGGRVEYLHRDPESRRRRRKGKSQIQ
jgi:hypothetical protein